MRYARIEGYGKARPNRTPVPQSKLEDLRHYFNG